MKGIGNGVDPRFQLRKDYPRELTEAQQLCFSRAVEFIGATVKHVNGDFKALMATGRVLGQLLLEFVSLCGRQLQ